MSCLFSMFSMFSMSHTSQKPETQILQSPRVRHEKERLFGVSTLEHLLFPVRLQWPQCYLVHWPSHAIRLLLQHAHHSRRHICAAVGSVQRQCLFHSFRRRLGDKRAARAAGSKLWFHVSTSDQMKRGQVIRTLVAALKRATRELCTTSSWMPTPQTRCLPSFVVHSM